MKAFFPYLAALVLVLTLTGPVHAAGPSFDPGRPTAINFTSPAPPLTKSAQSETASKREWKKAWIASWIAFAAVSALDAHSSQGRREANPLLRNSDGRFSNGKASILKGAIGGGFFAFQWWTAKKHPEANYYRAFTIANTGATAGLGAITIRNYGLPAPQITTPASTPLPDYLRPVE